MAETIARRHRSPSGWRVGRVRSGGFDRIGPDNLDNVRHGARIGPGSPPRLGQPGGRIPARGLSAGRRDHASVAPRGRERRRVPAFVGLVTAALAVLFSLPEVGGGPLVPRRAWRSGSSGSWFRSRSLRRKPGRRASGLQTDLDAAAYTTSSIYQASVGFFASSSSSRRRSSSSADRSSRTSTPAIIPPIPRAPGDDVEQSPRRDHPPPRHGRRRPGRSTGGPPRRLASMTAPRSASCTVDEGQGRGLLASRGRGRGGRRAGSPRSPRTRAASSAQSISCWHSRRTSRTAPT